MRALVIPPAAQRDDNAIQMISAWIAEKGLHCTLNIGMWKADGKPEASAWGILLADLVRHIGDAIQEEFGVSAEETTQQVLEALHREIGEPTSPRTGGFHPGHT